jgi:zinc protease
MIKKLLALALLLTTVAVTAQQLPTDPAVRKGKLKNGLTYYIRYNNQTPNLGEFYIAQRVGSILEEPRQRGLAHFLEHMAFNGTQHFRGKEGSPDLRAWCESKGIKFGANLNAYTSVDETVYNISSAPVNRPGVVDSCLLILCDWSNNLLLQDDEIDKERGVIHEEWRTRRSGMAMMRLMEDAQPVIYAGSKYADCMPIGSMDVVDNFPYQDLRDYYEKWYRPDLQGIIVVGDVDVDHVEKKIVEMFDTIAMPKNAAKRIYYPVPDNKKMIVHTAVDDEQPAVIFTLYQKRESTPRSKRGNVAYYKDDMLGTMVRMMINDRLKEIAKQPNPAFISGSVRDGGFFLAATKDAFSGGGTMHQDSVLRGIEVIVGEMERARQHGFTQTELDRQLTEQLRWAENSYTERDKRTNKHFVSHCLRNFTDNEPLMSAGQELELVKKLVKEITLKDVNRAVREMITDRNQVVTIYGPARDGYQLPSKESIEKTILDAQKKKYTAYQDKELPEQLISELPAAGRIVAEKEGPFGYKQWVLSNGMNVWLKNTDYEADAVNLQMFSKGGQSYYGVEDVPSMSYLSAVVRGSGVGDFDDETLEKMLTGKTVSVHPFVSGQSEGMEGYSTQKDARTMFELIYLYFTAPRKDTQFFENLMQKQASFLKNRDASPKVTYSDSINAILYGYNPRLEPIRLEDLPKVKLDRIFEIYKERFSDAADFDAIFTGTIDEEALRPLVCQYLASLPSRLHVETGDFSYTGEPVLDTHTDIVPGTLTRRFGKSMKTSSTRCSIYYNAPVEFNAWNDLRMDVLAQVMRIIYTEKVREEQGGTYGVSVSGGIYKYPKEEGLLKISFETDPDKFEKLIPIVYEWVDSVAQNGPSIELLRKVQEYELKTYDQASVLNNYWQYCMYHYLYEGIDYDKNYKELVKQLTPENIAAMLRDILKPGNRIEVTMQPEKVE